MVGDAIAPTKLPVGEYLPADRPDGYLHAATRREQSANRCRSPTSRSKPSRNLIAVNDDVYIITYNTVSTGSLLGQGQASIAITNSGFTLTNPFDSTKAKFIFADLNIYDAGVGGRPVHRQSWCRRSS